VSGEHEPSVILKDNDIKYKIRLPRLTTENLLNQIRADADFLLSIGVMDYSLLGTGAMHYCADVCVLESARHMLCWSGIKSLNCSFIQHYQASSAKSS
jgi:hypothetical protein